MLRVPDLQSDALRVDLTRATFVLPQPLWCTEWNEKEGSVALSPSSSVLGPMRPRPALQRQCHVRTRARRVAVPHP